MSALLSFLLTRVACLCAHISAAITAPSPCRTLSNSSRWSLHRPRRGPCCRNCHPGTAVCGRTFEVLVATQGHPQMTPEPLFPDHVSPQFGVFLVLCDYPHCCLLLTPLPALLLKAALASVFLPRHLRCPTCSEPWLCALRPRGETALVRPSICLPLPALPPRATVLMIALCPHMALSSLQTSSGGRLTLLQAWQSSG